MDANNIHPPFLNRPSLLALHLQILKMSAPANKELAAALFTATGANSWQCRLCSRRIEQLARKGYTNLKSHLVLRHADSYLSEFNRWKQQQPATDGNQPASGSVPCSGDSRSVAKALSSWVEWLVSSNLPPESCEDSGFSKFMALEPTTAATLRTCLMTTHRTMTDEMAIKLSGQRRIGVALNTWKQHGLVFIAVFAVVPVEGNPDDFRQRRSRLDKAVRETMLLKFRAIPESSGPVIADEVAMLFDLAMGTFDVDVDQQVVFLVGEPDEFEQVVGKWPRLQIVRTADRVFDAAVAAHVRECVGGDIEAVRAAIRSLLDLPSTVTQILSSRLNLDLSMLPRPVAANNASDWSATFAMIKAYLEVHGSTKDAIDGARVDDDTAEDAQIITTLCNLLVSNDAKHRLDNVCAQLVDLESVENKLTLRHGTPLHRTKVLFGGVARRFIASAEVLTSHNSHTFESGVVKVLEMRESTLTVAEKKSLSRFKRFHQDSDDDGDDAGTAEEVDFATGLLLEDAGCSQQFGDLWWVPSSANDAALVFPPGCLSAQCSSMTPWMVEVLAMLRYNRALWTHAPIAMLLQPSSGDQMTDRRRKRPRVNTANGERM